MKTISQQQVSQALYILGVRHGDRLLIHSAIQFLGQPQDGIGLYLAALLDAIGRSGTLAVPAFNFAFARGERFDPAVTPSEGMGSLAEYIRRQPSACRTPHPMQSLAVIGPDAQDLAGRDTPSAFDPASAFERLLELDYKILLLGADCNAVSLIHYSEQRARVPYRYWKDFSGHVRRAAEWEECNYRMFVRDLEINPVLDLQPVQQRLHEAGQWNTTGLNYGLLALCRATEFVAAADHLLLADPWALVSNRDQARQAYLQKTTTT